MKKKYIIYILFALVSVSAMAQEFDMEPLISSKRDTTKVDSLAPKKYPKGFIGKVIKYFSESNKEEKGSKFDMRFIGGPSYSQECGVGIGLVGAGQYRIKGAEDLQPSEMAAYLNVGTKGMLGTGVEGVNFFPGDKHRLKYNVELEYLPSNYWGMGYDNAIKDENLTKMRYLQFTLNANFMWRILPNTYLGPVADFKYITVTSMENDSLLLGQPKKLPTFGMGFSLLLDTRDVVTNAYKGVYLELYQLFSPRFLGNGDYGISTTRVDFRLYHRVWKGAVFAYQVLSEFNFGNPSWATMSRVGGSRILRGYYYGRYRDKYSASAQFEIRQKVWKRFGIVAWGGLGTVFHDKESFKHILPNYGFGVRWEFKNRMNVRIDWGFGRKGENAIAFNINESF